MSKTATVLDRKAPHGLLNERHHERRKDVKVFVVVHDYYSHDMFVTASAKAGSPEVVGVYSSRLEARKYIRPEADDFIVVLTLDKPVRNMDL
jgi:hypothetical protein